MRMQFADDIIRRALDVPYPDDSTDTETGYDSPENDPNAFDRPTPDSVDSGHSLEELAEMTNIAAILDENTLTKIGSEVVEQYKADLQSRADWDNRTDSILKMAEMQPEAAEKDYPFAGASNMVHVLVARSAVQFGARAEAALLVYPLLKGVPTGEDEQGQKAKRGEREADYLNYLLTEQMDFPDTEAQRYAPTYMVGDSFAKTYWDHETGLPVVDYVEAKDLVMNYCGPRVKRARAKTHHYWLYRDEIVEKIRSGEFRDVDLGEGKSIKREGDEGESVENQYDVGYLILEQHRYWDLDNDGYAEPYVVFTEHETGRVLRITARYNASRIRRNEEGKVLKIFPIEHFDDFPTLPPMRKRAYGLGMGWLLYYCQQGITSLINQMIDAGNLNNACGGFISGDVRFPGQQVGPDGKVTIDTNMWNVVQFDGDDINKHIFQFKFPSPSQFQFALLGYLSEQGNQLSSSSEIMSGNQPHANMPATSVMALINQGQQVYSNILKRYHRSYKSIYKKIYELVGVYGRPQLGLDQLQDSNQPVFYGAGQQLFAGDLDNDGMIDVMPESDPKNLSDEQKQARGQLLGALAGRGLNDKEIHRRILRYSGEPDIDRIVPSDEQPTPPPPELLVEEEKLRQSNEKLAVDRLKAEAEVQKILAEADKVRIESELVLSSIGDIKLRNQVEEVIRQNQELQALVQTFMEREYGGEQQQLGTDNPGEQPGRPEPGGIPEMAGAPGNGVVPEAPAGVAGGEAGGFGSGQVPVQPGGGDSAVYGGGGGIL